MFEKYLVINCGSSSLKFSLYNMPGEKEIVNGLMEKIGEPDSSYTLKYDGKKVKKDKYFINHIEAVTTMIDELIGNRFITSTDEIKGIGHRILHGGEIYSDSVIITDEVIENISKLKKLGPLHHPGELAGILGVQRFIPNAINVAVFDTAFHQTMPKQNYIYPVPYEWYTKYGIRKYGFHGTSHKYITTEMKQKLGRNDVNLIICHVGNGASISAIKNGLCYDTTMGLTPLDGLMMGTRSGSIDPSIIQYIMKESGKTIDEVTDELNKNSGFLGVCGAADCRDVISLADKGDERAILAIEMYADRIAKYIANYYIELEGKVDSIVFTAGLLENSPLMRKLVVDKLAPLNIYMNNEINNNIAGFKETHEGIISNDNSKIDVIVLPTNEEKIILDDTYKIVKNLENEKKFLKH